MTDLDLPACFEEDWHLQSEAGPWAVLDALGRGLLALERLDSPPDPVWAALAHLQDRDPRHRLGEHVARSGSFHLPPAWLTPTRTFPGPGALHETTDFARSRTWSEHGFLLAEAPIPPDDQPDNLDPVAPALARWLVRVLPYIRFRLARAIGLQPEESLVRSLLWVRARLYLTGSHLDLVMRQESASIRVRMAGLDRDPGWLRSYGRVISFHFK